MHLYQVCIFKQFALLAEMFSDIGESVRDSSENLFRRKIFHDRVPIPILTPTPTPTPIQLLFSIWSFNELSSSDGDDSGTTSKQNF